MVSDPADPDRAWSVPSVVRADGPEGTEQLARRIAATGEAAIGIAVDASTEGVSQRGSAVEGSTRLAVALPAQASAAAEVHLLAATDPRELAALAEVLDPQAGAARGPYVVLADAKQGLGVLRRIGLAPRRVGCIRTAATLVAEGADGRRDDRPLVRCLEERLQRTFPLALRDRGPVPDALLAASADVLVPLMRSYTPELRQRGSNRVYELELALLPAVLAMEAAGVRLDVPAFERVAAGWERERAQTEDPHRLARLDKLISTYRFWARDHVDLDGRIRCRLHPLATDSGRFACTDPNLQQVPGEHTAPGLRACFVPADGYLFVLADYAQIELRVAAHLAPCAALREVFRQGRDPHRATASAITGKAEHQISAHERKLAKAVNFGFLFGMGARRFQEYARDGYGIELDEGAAIAAREAFLAAFPGIAAWHRKMRTVARRAEHEDIVVHTALGRGRRFPAGLFSYPAALNIPVQGTAAEGFKLAMTRLHPALAELRGRGILCVHDEYLAEVPADRGEAARAAVDRIMTEAMASVVDSVPIAVDARLAASWAGK